MSTIIFAIPIDPIHGTRHLYTRFRTDGIKAISRGISVGKQVTKFATTSNRRRVCSFSKNPSNYFKPRTNAGYDIVETTKQKKRG